VAQSPPFPPQPDDLSRPVEDWPEGPVDARVDSDRLDQLVDRAFEGQPTPDLATTHALVIVHHGRIVKEL